MPEPQIALRIGALARRVGVSPEALRAWERRYGLLRPTRTPGGYRIYGAADLERARRMRELTEQGWGAAEAARALLDADVAAVATRPADTIAELKAALLAFDADRADATLDGLLASHALDTALRDAVLPVLRAIGEEWSLGVVSVAQEHFASELVGGRLRALARGWDAGDGPLAVLACPSAEQHDLGLLCCGLALRERGFRIAYLGADTPADALRDAVAATRPAVVVLAVLQADLLARAAAGLAALSADVSVLVGGAGASLRLVAQIGGRRLAGDPVGAAAEIAAAHGGG